MLVSILIRIFSYSNRSNPKTILLEIRLVAKHFWINVGNGDRGVKGQTVRRLALVSSLRVALDFFFLLLSLPKLDLR